MNINDTIEKVNVIFKDVLDNGDIKIAYETTAKDVEEWDSLSHIQLVVAIEKSFNIRFSSGEISSFKNVGEMCEVIAKKVG